MKKKFLAMYALAGALVASPVFTSCVDSEESASVEALRGAKVEQLKSIATLNNAKAQAETTLANAEAALKAAMAALEQAKADSISQATEQAAQKFALEIEKLKLQNEKALAKLQKELLDAQKQLADKKEQMAEAEYQELKELINVYSNRLVLYTQYSQAILEEEAKIAAEEADLADWETINAEDIAEQELSIKWYQNQIEALKQYANYTDDIDAMKTELKELKNARDLANDKYTTAYKAWDAITYADLKKEYNIEKLEEAIEETNMYKLYDNSLDYAYLANNYNVNPIKTYLKTSFTIEQNDYTYSSLSLSNLNDSLEVEMEYKDVREFRIEIDNYVAVQKATITEKKAEIEKAETGLQAVYDAAVKASATAKEAYEKATADEEQDKEQAYKEALGKEKGALEALNDAKTEITVAEDEIAAYELIYSLVSDEKAAEDFVAAVKAYNEAIVALHTEKAEAYFAKEAAYEAKSEAQIAYNTLNTIMNTDDANRSINFYNLFYNSNGNEISINGIEGTIANGFNWAMTSDELNKLSGVGIRILIEGQKGAISIAEAIEELEGLIKGCEEEIEKLKDVTSKEQQLEIDKIELENMKLYHAAMKAELDATKVKLDALQAKLSGTEE